MDERISRHSLDCARMNDAAARARLITERLRAGVIARARVELAAWLGDAASRVAIGAPERATGGGDFERWARGVEAHGREVAVRAALVATRHAVAEVRPEGAAAGGVASALETVEVWLASPCDEHVAAAVRASRAGPDDPYPSRLLMGDGDLEPDHERDVIVTFAVALARCTATVVADRERRLEGLSIWNEYVEWLFLDGLTAARIMTRAVEVVRCCSGLADEVAQDAVRGRVRDALIVWSLGAEAPLASA